MKNPYTHGKHLHTTSLKNTVLPVLYVDRYDLTVKDHMHIYKFSNNNSSHIYASYMYFEQIIIDIYVYILSSDPHISCSKPKKPAVTIITSPPSTTYIRKERKTDSMRYLCIHGLKNLCMYNHFCEICTCIVYKNIYSIYTKHLKHEKAQHIDGNRAKRLHKSKGKYKISPLFKLYFWYLIHIRNIRFIRICIIDDVTTTGSTLLSCKETLDRYIKNVQKKKPACRVDIQVFSLTH